LNGLICKNGQLAKNQKEQHRHKDSWGQVNFCDHAFLLDPFKAGNVICLVLKVSNLFDQSQAQLVLAFNLANRNGSSFHFQFYRRKNPTIAFGE
jgi:hypothetical protein